MSLARPRGFVYLNQVRSTVYGHTHVFICVQCSACPFPDWTVAFILWVMLYDRFVEEGKYSTGDNFCCP